MARDSRARRLAELLALTGFAVAQPVLDVTGRAPDFFLFRQPTRVELWVLLAVVAFLPPLLLWGIEAVAGLVSEAAERVAHLAFTGLLLVVVAVQVGKQLGVYGAVLAVLALAAGGVLAVLVARSPRLRQALAYAAPAPLVFVLVFALTTPAGALLRSAEAGAGIGADGQRPPIVVLFFDEFPARALLDAKGEVDGRLFPSFARLAAGSTRYSNATGVSGYTPYAIPAMLSGRFPRADIAPSYIEYPDNLFTLLGHAYRVTAYETVSQLCPPRHCEDVPAGRGVGLRPLIADTAGVVREVVSPARPPQRQGEELQGELGVDFRVAEGKKPQPERVTAFLDGLGKPGERPTLDFLHLLLPHIPYRHLPSGLRYQQHAPWHPLGRGVADNPNHLRNPEPYAMTLHKQRLLLQLAYVDGLLGQVIDRLQKTGVWDDALVVLAADHGEGFSPDQKVRDLDSDNPPDLAYVPLFVKTPGQAAGRVDARNAMTVDILPTVADVLGVRLPYPADGVSLLGEPRPTMAKQWYDRTGRPTALDGARWSAAAKTGFAPGLVRAERGPEGIYAVGPLGRLVGRRVAALPVGAPSPVVARSRHPVGWADVDRASGTVPSLLWGELDRAPGAGERTWLAVSVNGTVAGAVPAVVRDGKWYFAGLVGDKHFKDGANDVVLYTVTGTTLHPLRWA